MRPSTDCEAILRRRLSTYQDALAGAAIDTKAWAHAYVSLRSIATRLDGMESRSSRQVDDARLLPLRLVLDRPLTSESKGVIALELIKMLDAYERWAPSLFKETDEYDLNIVHCRDYIDNVLAVPDLVAVADAEYPEWRARLQSADNSARQAITRADPRYITWFSEKAREHCEPSHRWWWGLEQDTDTASSDRKPGES